MLWRNILIRLLTHALPFLPPPTHTHRTTVNHHQHPSRSHSHLPSWVMLVLSTLHQAFTLKRKRQRQRRTLDPTDRPRNPFTTMAYYVENGLIMLQCETQAGRPHRGTVRRGSLGSHPTRGCGGEGGGSFWAGLSKSRSYYGIVWLILKPWPIFAPSRLPLEAA